MPNERREGDPRDHVDDAARARDAVEALVEEFFDHRRRGDRSDVDEFARRVPGREEEFRRLVGALNVLEVAAAAAAPRAPAQPAGERLGRFRLLRLVGRGGMGDVYEAIDEELGRHVALKVLPGRAALDARELARFQREAQSAARLNHPHIVPLFGVGADDGAHWLAMQFIPGESLEQLLRRGLELESVAAGADASIAARSAERARMDPREVARHGLAIAEALACAHAEGVLHRDVKPSNLLLDRSGTIWVTDFGLAKSEGAASITRTGEAVGTPRYMAPEAFSGWADPRTDVWGVGATLYELLAGRPAFDGHDRAQLLKQIHDVEPPHLDQAAPAVPRDLATIVHKCLQKEPAARYSSAQELAEDLRRFLDGRPIDARPPSLAYRVGLVARRHRIAVRAAIAVAAGVAVLLVAWAATLSRETTAAIASRRRAEKNLATAMSAIDRMLTRVAENRLFSLPGSETLRASLLQDALALDLEILAEQQDDPSLRLETANARHRAARIHRMLGQLEPAAALSRAAMDDFAALVDGGALEEPRHELAEAARLHVEVELDRGELEAAEAAALRGIEAASLHVLRAPACTSALQCRLDATATFAQVLWQAGRVGEVIARFEAAFMEFDRALGEPSSASTSDLRSLCESCDLMSRAHWSLGRREVARREARRAYDLAVALAGRPDSWAEDRGDVALDAAWLAEISTTDAIDPSALTLFEEAEGLLEKELTRRPDVPQLRAYLAQTLDAHAAALQRSGDFDGARARLGRGLEVVREADGGAMTTEELGEAVGCRSDLGMLEVALGRSDEAAADFERAIELGESRPTSGVGHHSLLRRVALAHGNRGIVARQQGDVARMKSEAEKAAASLEVLAQKRPDDADLQLDRCAALSFLGEALMHDGRPHEAIPVLERAGAAIDEQMVRFGEENRTRAKRSLCWVLLGNARRMDGAFDAAADAIANAERIDRALLGERPDDVAPSLTLATTLVDHALLERVRARPEVALGRDVEALRLATAACRRPEEPARARGLLRLALAGIVKDLEQSDSDDASDDSLGEALAAATDVVAPDAEALRLVARTTELRGPDHR